MFQLDKLLDVEFFLNNVQIDHNQMMELIYHLLNDVLYMVFDQINIFEYHYKNFVHQINIEQKNHELWNVLH